METFDRIDNYQKELELIHSKKQNFNQWQQQVFEQQDRIIHTLKVFPSFTGDNFHLTGAHINDASAASFPIIKIDEQKTCCILSIVQGENTVCPASNIKALGAQGKKGVPYIFNFDGTKNVEEEIKGKNIYSDEKEQKLVAKFSKIDVLVSQYKNQPPTYYDIKDDKGKDLEACFSYKGPNNRFRYLGLDEFSNETLIAYVIFSTYRSLLDKKSNSFDPATKTINTPSGSYLPPLFIKHYDAGICLSNDNQKTGINIMELADLGTLVDFVQNNRTDSYRKNVSLTNGDIINIVDWDIMWEILKQVIVGLDFLQENLSFTSGDLKAANVFVKSEPVSSVYKGVTLNADFTCKVADYGKSSITLPVNGGLQLRIYNRLPTADFYLYFVPFQPNIGTTAEGVKYYWIDNYFTQTVYVNSRHMGIPFYSTFDVYTLIVSMLTIPAYFYSFFSSDKLLSIWKRLWIVNSHALKVQNLISEYVQKGGGLSINDSIAILKNVYMRCDILQVLITLFANDQLAEE